MSKWFGLSLALVVVGAGSTASAQMITRFGRLVAEEQPAPAAVPQAAEPAPPVAEPAPEPAIESAPIVEGTLQKGSVSYGYPFVDGCCPTSSYCGNVWGGYAPTCFGRHCGLAGRHGGWRGAYCGSYVSSCTQKSSCAQKSSCSQKGDICGDPCVDPCAPVCRPGLFSRIHARRALCAPTYGCGVGCGYGWGYGVGYGVGYGISGGCSSCGGGAVIKGDVEPAPKEAQPLDAPVIENQSARWWQNRTSPLVIPTSAAR
jgi:hypothetical protein